MTSLSTLQAIALVHMKICTFACKETTLYHLLVLFPGLSQEMRHLFVAGERLLQLVVDVLLSAADLLQSLGDLSLQLVQLRPGGLETLLDTISVHMHLIQVRPPVSSICLDCHLIRL